MKGIGVSQGVGLGKCMLLQSAEIKINQEYIQIEKIQDELFSLDIALEQVFKKYNRILDKAKALDEEQSISIINAQIMILNDYIILDQIKRKIKEMPSSALYAVWETYSGYAKKFDEIEDSYLRERASDIIDIRNEIIRCLAGVEDQDISSINEDTILVSHDISPSLLMTIDRNWVKGIVCEIGGKTSHMALMAKNMRIPAVVGVENATGTLKNSQISYVNGSTGEVETDLNTEKINKIREDIKKQELRYIALESYKNLKTVTKDGRYINLYSNIIDPEETSAILENGAEGIGLYRTEFLFMDRRSPPNEEEQFEAYQKVVQGMGGKPVTIRTLDIGGDKEIDYIKFPKEQNPFLGWRAIRFCLDNKSLFLTQLKAILRASNCGKVKILFPMISSIDEVILVKNMLNEAKEILKLENKPYDDSIEVGIMIEIPSAAITADLMIEEVDFFSIGTNDLTQYMLACDRGNEKVSKIYNYYHPALLRIIKSVIEVSHKVGKHTGICGEMASDPTAAILLLGMGLDEFSVNSSALLEIRKIINSVDIKFAEDIVKNVMSMKTSLEIEEYLRMQIVL